MEIVTAEVKPLADLYLSSVLTKPPQDVWTIFLLCLSRIVPAIALAPFLGGKLLPNIIKMGLGVAVVFVFLPFLIHNSTTSIPTDTNFILLLAKEALIGSIIGFIIAVPFQYTQGAGALIDHQRGSQSLQVLDPSTQMQTSPTGTLFNNMMLVIFFFIGGPILFFDGLLTSFTILPIDHFLPPAFFDASQPLWNMMIKLCNLVVKMSLQLSAPALISMLLSDLFLGIANRMAPQVQISFLLWSLKAFIGIGMVWVGWWLILKQLEAEGLGWIKTFTQMIQSL